MAYISLGNLTRYDGKLKDWADGRYASERYSNWQKTEKAGAVTCYPVPESRMEPVVEFKFKEIPPAEGEKGPDNPSTIEEVSSVRIVRCGKNIITYPYLDRSCVREGITFTVNENGSITVNGTASTTEYAHFYISGHGTKVRLCQGQTYFLSGVPAGYDNNLYLLYESYTLNHTYDRNYHCYSNGLTINPTNDCLGFFQILVKPGTTVDNAVIYPQLELGSCSTEYEIPNSTAINYPINSYYSGYVDVANGILTVTHEIVELDGTENITRHNNFLNVGRYQFLNIFTHFPGEENETNQVSTHFKFSGSNSDTSRNNFYVSNVSGTLIIFSSIGSSAEEFSNWLATQKTAGTPVKVVCKLATPYTVLIPSVEIRSLPFLNKMQPRLNTLFTDAESIQVGYQKSPIRTTYELDNAILSLGGNE